MNFGWHFRSFLIRVAILIDYGEIKPGAHEAKRPNKNKKNSKNIVVDFLLNFLLKTKCKQSFGSKSCIGAHVQKNKIRVGTLIHFVYLTRKESKSIRVATLIQKASKSIRVATLIQKASKSIRVATLIQ
jgi:hypothetical protein